MKAQHAFLAAAIAGMTLAVGCATTGTTSTARPVSTRAADAVIHISGLSCPF